VPTERLTLKGFAQCNVGGAGPEDTLAIGGGAWITGLADGRIMRIGADFSSCETLATTGGRPLGLEMLPDGGVVICDATQGLLRLDIGSGQITTLVDQIGGTRLMMCNNPAVGRDGTIYFSASSTRHGLDDAERDALEGRATGRLFARAPDGDLRCLARDLYFANGVVLSPDERFVLVAETPRARISRVWLQGPKAGQRDIFIEDMPGLPDNLNIGSDGLIWAAFVVPVTDDIRKLWRTPLALRWLVARLPESLLPRQKNALMVAAYDFDGQMRKLLDVRDGPYHFVTSAREQDGHLYLTSIEENTVARVVV